MILWRPTRPPRTSTKKRSPFYHRGLECKSRKPRNTLSDRQIWPWNAEWSRAKTNRVLPREHTGHSRQHKMILHMDITRWPVLKSDWLILCRCRWKIPIQSAKTRPGADCGSDHCLLNTKFRLKLKKVGESTRTFKYDLNQIPYDYTVEVMNRFKGLDLVDRAPEEQWA